MINKYYCYLYVFSLLILCTSTKKLGIEDTQRILILNLEGKSYDKLWLRTEYSTVEKPYSDGTTPVSLAFEIEGKSDNGYNWIFSVPDSIDQKRTEGYMVKKQPFDFKLNKEGLLMFSSSDRTGISGIDLDKDTIVIEGKFIKTIINEKYKENDDVAYVLTDTFVLAPIFEYDIINITSITKNTNIEIFLDFPAFAELPDRNYEEELQKRIEYVKKHPDSKSLFNSFLWAEGYRNKQDQKLVFDNFSNGLRSTADGLHFERYLSKIFAPCSLDTLKLTSIKTNNIESVIVDKTKYTLVIFSASWCGPCHKQIPLLKEIHKNLNNKLNMVYITIDDEDHLEQWRKLIDREKIQWHSLIAGEHYQGLKEHYSITGIPYSILIYPDGKEEVIDVRFNKDIDKLYKLINDLL